MTNLEIVPTAITGVDAVQQTIWRSECELIPLAGGGYATYDDIFHAYIQSPPGQHHMQQPPRFYAGYGSEDLTQEMLLRLHPDTHPVGHMAVIRSWFQRIASQDPQLFTQHTAALGNLTATLHDTGENTDMSLAALAGVPTPPGDIARGKKKPIHRAYEERLRRKVYETILPEIPGDVVEEIEDLASHRAQPSTPGSYAHGEHRLAVVFDALELAHSLGALGVATAATMHVASQRYAHQPVNKALLELAESVGVNTLHSLERYTPIFQIAGKIAFQRTWLRRVFADLKETTVLAA